MQNEESYHGFGEFHIGDNMLFGELKSDGRHTNLRLHSHRYIQLSDISGQYITGQLSDNVKVSLIECNLPPVPGQRSTENETSYFADIFPHFVVLGAKHVDPSEHNTHVVHWWLPDLNSIFHDFDAFAVSLEPESFIEALVAAQERQIFRKVSIGPNPEIQYFTGNYEVFSCETVLGKFAVEHDFSRNFGGTSGVWMQNRLRASLSFQEPICFRDAIVRISKVSKFLSISIGSPQNIEDIRIEDEAGGEGVSLKVIPSLPIRYDRQAGQHKPGPMDVLLEGVSQPNEFAAVLRHWLATDDEMAMPRSRLWDTFKKQRYFDPDRIIAAANLFDTIPSRRFPDRPAIATDIQMAIAQAKDLFRPLPSTPEREAIMRELSRVSRHSLRTKVKHWARDVIGHEKWNFDELEFVIDCAVNCRNFFVHGGKPEFDYLKELNLFAFLIRTLEFCYIVPEFLKAGWSFDRYAGFHPFGEYRINYVANLRDLREAVGGN